MSTTVEYDILVEVLDAVKDLKKLQTQTKKTKGGLDDTKKSGLTMASEIGAAFTGLSGAASMVAGAVTKVAGAFVDAAKASFELTRGVVDNINDLNDLSTVSGVSAQSIEALKLAFVSSGQSADAANTALQQFPRVLNSIQKGTGDASAAFEALVGKTEAARLKTKDANTVFRSIVSSLEGIEDKTQKAQVATAIFGRSASGIIQALGAGGFDEFTASIERFGPKAPPEATASAAEYQKALALLFFLGDRVRQTFVESVGGVDLFTRAINTSSAILSGLNAALNVASPLLSAATSAAVRLGQAFSQFLIDTFLQQIVLVSSLIQKFESFISVANDVSEALTGKRIFSGLEVGLDAAVLSVDTLREALIGGGRAFVETANNLRGLSDNATGAKPSLSALQKQVAEFLKTLGQSKKPKEEDAKATKDQARAERDRREGLKKLQQAQAQVSQIQKSATSDLLSALDRINQREEERLQRLREITKEQKISTAEAQKAVSARAEREREQLSANQRQSQTVSNISTAGTVVNVASDPSALISAVGGAFGPVGQATAEVVNALSALGQKTPEQIKEEAEAFFFAIAKGIELLPEILFSVLPPILLDTISMIVSTLIRTLVEALISLGKFIVEGFKKLFNFKQFLLDLFNTISKLVGDFVQPILDALDFNVFGGGGRMLSAQSGLRFTGQREGLALLHRGETVVPRSGQMSSSVARDVEAQTGGGGVTININSAVTERSAIDSLVRKIEDRFGSFGQSTSPLFGGQ